MDKPLLAYRHVVDVLRRAGKSQDMIVVGGQALNAWAETFDIADEFHATAYGLALSADIDFLATVGLAKAFAAAHGVSLKVAGMEDIHSPNSALATVKIAGHEYTIDFLHTLSGFTAKEMGLVPQWAAELHSDGDPPVRVRVMHPVHCLQSQGANVYGVLNRRDNPEWKRHVRRVDLGIEIARRQVVSYLEHGDWQSALKSIETCYAIARTPFALRAHYQDGRDVTAVARVGGLPATFMEKRLPKLNSYLEPKRQRHQAQQERATRRRR